MILVDRDVHFENEPRNTRASTAALKREFREILSQCSLTRRGNCYSRCLGSTSIGPAVCQSR